MHKTDIVGRDGHLVVAVVYSIELVVDVKLSDVYVLTRPAKSQDSVQYKV